MPESLASWMCASASGPSPAVASGTHRTRDDHAGATEVGAFSYECEAQPGGIHFNEDEFILEIIDPATGAPAERLGLGAIGLGQIGGIDGQAQVGFAARDGHA